MNRIGLVVLIVVALTAVGQEQRTTTSAPIVPSLVSADLRLLKSFTPSRGGGSFTITVTNYGPSTHPGPITVTDTLPAGIAFTSGTPGCTGGASVTCVRQGPLAPGNSFTLTLNVAVTATTAVVNCASIVTKFADSNAANNRACACVSPAVPCRALRIDISTGSNNGAALPVGSNDTDWKVTQVPNGATGGGGAPAFVPQQGPPWMVPPLGTAWITAKPASGTNPQVLAGDYVYEYVFELPPDMGGRCVLNGQFATDNLLSSLTLDGTQIGSWTAFGFPAFTSLHPLSPPAVIFPAVSGPHTIRATVHNGQASVNTGSEARTGFLFVGTVGCECARP